MKQKSPFKQKLIVITIIVMILLATVLVVLDWREIKQIVGTANWQWTIVALVFTFISYLCLSFGYVLVNKVFGIETGWLQLFQVGIVSTALNNLLAFLGAAGHSLRLALIRRPGVVAGEILAASIFHSYINNVMMLLMLAVGLISLLASHIVYGGGAVSLGFITGIAIVSMFIATAILFAGRLRTRILKITNTVWHFVTRHNLPNVINDFDYALQQGVVSLRSHKLAVTLLLVLMAADWAFAAAAIWFCLKAFGTPPGFGVLLSGFGIGISAGNVSMLPGGLGVQEASMAGTYALLGIPFSQGVLAAILFRVVYDFVPFFASLVLYGGLIRKNRQANR